MSVFTVARDDVRNVRRSHVVLGVVGAVTAMVALIFAAEMDIYDEPYRTLFDVLAFVAFVLPLFLAPLAYLSIAGDRTSGRITFALGLPNRRWEYYLGKLTSRFAVAAATVLASTLAGLAVAAVGFASPPEIWRFAVFAGISLLYALAFVSLFVAISAATASRSRAMFGAIGAYFVLVVFWFGFVPFLNLETLLDAVADLPGVSLSETIRTYAGFVSPATAYLQASKAAFAGVLDQYPAFQQFNTDDRAYATVWFNVAVLLAWTVVSLAAGYLRFRDAELG